MKRQGCVPFDTTVLGLVWATVAITVYSGVVYIVAAVKLLNR